MSAGDGGKRMKGSIGRVVCMGLFWTVCGCGSSREVVVTGTVTLDNQPLADALVTFYPEGKTPGLGGSGRTGADGKYTLTPSRKGQELAPGAYRVVIRRLLNPDGSPADPNVPPIESQAQETLPARYSQRDRTVLRADVAKEQKVYDFPLESDAKKK